MRGSMACPAQRQDSVLMQGDLFRKYLLVSIHAVHYNKKVMRRAHALFQFSCGFEVYG